MSSHTSDNSNNTYDNNPYLKVASFFDIDGSVLITDLQKEYKGLELEIGFGRGHFIRDRAKVVPDTRVLGIETGRKLVYLTDKKSKEQNISNILVMHGDAREVISRMTPDVSIDNVFVNFPDPWWKARHQKRMVVTDQLSSNVVRMLKKGGGYFVQTDVEFRALEYRDVLLNVKELQPMGDNGFIEENPFNARTAREKRCIELDMPVFRLYFTKI